MASKRRLVSALTVTAWAALILALLPHTLALEGRLVYSESALLPEDLESIQAFPIVARAGLEAPDTLIVIFKPNTLSDARAVEEAVKLEAKGLGARVIGPYTAYNRVMEEYFKALSKAVEEGVGYVERLEKLAGEVSRLWEDLGKTLDFTYGLAEAYLEAYTRASAAGAPDPYEAAYNIISARVPPQLQPLLDEFHKRFKVLVEGGVEPREAAEKALREAVAKLNPQALPVVEAFGLENYRDEGARLEFLYDALKLDDKGITISDLEKLVRDPEGAPESIVAGRLAAQAHPCAAQALELAVEGIDPIEAVRRSCGKVAGEVLEYPDSLPGELRNLLAPNGYGVVLAFFPRKLGVNEASSLIDSVRQDLEGKVEAYFYGTASLTAELGVGVAREAERIDKATAVLVGVVTIALLGSLAAPVIILVVGGTALLAAMGLLSITATKMDVYYLARVVMIPVAFGVAVDYSVFYLFRVLEERGRGKGWEEAVATAWRRAGRAIVLGGVAVVLGFTAYVLTPHEALRGIGAALAIGALVSFVASITLLPSLLILLGERASLWPGLRTVSAGWQGKVLRRAASASIRLAIPLTAAMIALTLIAGVALASTPPSGNPIVAVPASSGYIEAARLAEEVLPLDTISRLYVVSTREPTGEVLEALKGVGATRADVREAGEHYIVVLGLPYDPFDDRAFKAVEGARGALARLGFEASVTGITAVRVDAVDSILDSFFTVTLPLAVALIIAYLAVGMGSLLVPLRLAATILFSSLASLALVALAFDAYLERLDLPTWIRSPVYWVTPIIVLGLMFTLGMDYDVFLTARIREELERLGGEREAILEAVEKTGVVITVCGLILASAFATLTISEIPLLKQVGATVALSILLDTFLVRPILVPAVMSLLGRYNWWPGRGLIRRWD
ncbi:MAG: MMPL family transporter [Desulfurococcales archaeon]|nr:MMPL family transporter [Desulfurococcales archaeon]